MKAFNFNVKTTRYIYVRYLKKKFEVNLRAKKK